MDTAFQPSPCPSREELAALTLGTLTEEAWQTVADHVETCADCAAALKSLSDSSDSGDELIGRLRELKGSAEPTIDESRDSVGVGFGSDIEFAEAAGDPRTNRLPPGTRLREYRLLERIGEGGMGTVYRAVHTRLERLVALKVLGGDRMHRPAAMTRFQREMKAVGQINHPNVVQATDAGESNGTHFLVMELVEGIDVARLVHRRGPLRVADACEIVRQACLGLANIHQHGLIHRDIKASNLILASGGTVKILDLGLALLQEGRHARRGTTSAGLVLGSFDYLAPEQADDPHTVDSRADLYSLGCTFFQLLTGQTPFPAPRYSTPLQKMKAHERVPPPPVQTLRDEVPREVGRIVAKLLAKKPEQRFESAAQVAAALQPFITGSDLAGLAAQALGPRSAEHQQSREHASDAQVREAYGDRPSPDRGRRWLWGGAVATAVACVLAAGVFQSHWRAPGSPVENAATSRQVPPVVTSAIPADALRREDIPEADLVLAGGGDRERVPKGLVAIAKGHRGWVMTVNFSPDGKTLASGGQDNSIILWDVASGKQRRSLQGHGDYVRHLAFSGDGKLLATASADRTIKLWDAETGAERHTFRGHGAVVFAVAFVNEKNQLASVSHDGLLKLWDVADGRELASLPAHKIAIGGVAASADGHWAATAGDDGAVKLWNLDHPAPVLAMTDHAGPASRVVFLPGDVRLASGGKDGRILIWDRQGKPAGTLAGHQDWVLCLAAAADGLRLASSGRDGTVRLWDLVNMRPIPLDFLPFQQGVDAVAFSPDGGYLATGNPDGSVYIVRLEVN